MAVLAGPTAPHQVCRLHFSGHASFLTPLFLQARRVAEFSCALAARRASASAEEQK
jgi:hypothetical protein